MKPDYQNSKIFIALPALAELSFLSEFIECVNAQTFRNFELVICINQPEEWWNKTKHIEECLNNQESLKWLQKNKQRNWTIIDKSSKGKGWVQKRIGVGWARKTIMDHISSLANEYDIILSLDVDTTFDTGYFQSVLDNFKSHPKHVALSVPYYHPLTEDEMTNRHILRYEIYMRYYALNLWRIQNPYNFSALGSAIAVPVWVYKRVGGLTPHQSGEDFYFLQKLRKFGELSLWNKVKVFPAARYSNRVLFGTGPAMIKGAGGDWSSYPIYDYEHFDDVKKSYLAFEKLFQQEINFPMKDFLQELFKDEKWYQPLRENSSSITQFVKACQHKVDALRVLQFLKFNHKPHHLSDEEMLKKYIQKFYPDRQETEIGINLDSDWSFDDASVKNLNLLRNFLQSMEENHQKNEQPI